MRMRYTVILILVLALALLGGCATKNQGQGMDQSMPAHQSQPALDQQPQATQAAHSKYTKYKAGSSKTDDAKDEFSADAEFGDDLDDGAKPQPSIYDPLEPWNRFVFRFNHAVYTGYIQPLAAGYRKVLPWEYRTMVKNFFYNILTPIRVVSNLLQLKVKRALDEVMRFLINSTIGIGGLVDPADEVIGLKKPPREDMDQAFGRWGIGPGFYIVWPLLGPNTLRGTAGLLADSYLDPIAYLTPLDVFFSSAAADYFNTYSFTIEDYKDMTDSALDPYIAVRDFYTQFKRKSILE